MKKCPRCAIEMPAAQLGAVPLNGCLQCKGMWFDRDELRQVKDLLEPDANWLDFDIWRHKDQLRSVDSGHMCPNCGIALKTITYGDTGVDVEFCVQCQGTWLDREKLEQIVKELNREINSKTFSQYVSESVKQAAEIITGPHDFASEWKDFTKVLYLMRLRLFVQTGGISQFLPF